MKSIKRMFFVIMFLFVGLVMVSCGGSEEEGMKIKVWTSEIKGVDKLTETQIKRYAEEKGVKISLEVVGMGEKSAPSQLMRDVENGPDLFFFAQDQLARLVQVNVITRLNAEATSKLKAEHDESSLMAATINEKLWAFPVTNDNSFVMFYDKRVVKEEHLGSLEDIIADCQEAKKKISFNLENEGGWYNASFFFATGCESSWEISREGTFESYKDNFNSDKGLIALRGMQKLLKATYSEGGSEIPLWNDSADVDNFNAAMPSAVVFSGTWKSKEAKALLGDNFGVAELPSFTVDGTSYHLNTFRGSKLLGIKKQTDATKLSFLLELAQYLSGEECQLERFLEFGWGPSNKAAQKNEKVVADEVLQSLNKQYAHAVIQGQIPANWWTSAEAYVTVAKNSNYDDVAALKKALDDYEKQLSTMLG